MSSAISGMVSGFSGAVTSYKQGKAQAKAYKREKVYEARKSEINLRRSQLETEWLEREAGLAGEKRSEEIGAAAERAKEAISTARARYGASGVALYEGSSAEVLTEMHKKSVEELASMEYWKAKEQESYRMEIAAKKEFAGYEKEFSEYRQAELNRAIRYSKRAASAGMWSGIMGGTSSALQGVSSMFSSGSFLGS